jgi:hypothetical protein
MILDVFWIWLECKRHTIQNGVAVHSDIEAVIALYEYELCAQI